MTEETVKRTLWRHGYRERSGSDHKKKQCDSCGKRVSGNRIWDKHKIESHEVESFCDSCAGFQVMFPKEETFKKLDEILDAAEKRRDG